ncbi:MAG: hypothetical protein LKJ17_06035 [Oscillospiraceae bacterium]|nr:hypothetical protein [Oscillospiraceae bacterium]
MRNRAAAFHRDNRGSGIVTVLVTMFFLSALGAALLFISFTGYQVKLSERKSKENFYQASAAMDQIHAGIEQAVADSVADAYTDVLEHYEDLNASRPEGTGLEDYLQQNFQDSFKEFLLEWNHPDDEDDSLFSQRGETVTYSPKVLLQFLNCPADGTRTIDETNDIYQMTTPNAKIELMCAESVSKGENDLAMTLEGVTLRYTARNYQTDITTDLAVKTPLFSYAPGAYSVNNISKIALVAKTGLQCGAASGLILSGDAYAGSVTVQNEGTLDHLNGLLVSGDSVVSDQSGKFNTAETSSLWAKSILVGNEAAVQLPGDTYVADDLTLSGASASAVLGDLSAGRARGKYVGYGCWSSEKPDDPAVNSSILINGRGASLDLGGLSSLMLAGNGFINTTGAEEGPTSYDYIMGQSIAARSDQLAYLVPEECLPEGFPANPYLVTQAINPEKLSSAMDKVRSLAAQESYYQYVGGVQDVYVHLNSTGDEKIAYLFLTFKNQNDANQYFKGYFQEHFHDINNYLTQYLSYYRAAASSMSGGGVYSGTISDGMVDGGLTEATAPDVLSIVSQQYQTRYKNLCQTLNEGISSNKSETPYEYLVNTELVEALPDTQTGFTDSSGNLEALIVKGDCMIDSGIPDTVKIVIATGDVTVRRNMNGLILSGGSATVRGNVTVQSDSDVSAALQAENGGKTLLSFLNIGSNTGGQGSGGTCWDANTLVEYADWSRK